MNDHSFTSQNKSVPTAKSVKRFYKLFCVTLENQTRIRAAEAETV